MFDRINHPPPPLFSGVRLALTPLSLLQARAAAATGPLLARARTQALAKRKEEDGDGGTSPPLAAVVAEAKEILKTARGPHPAWVVAAPLAQVREERMGWWKGGIS